MFLGPLTPQKVPKEGNPFTHRRDGPEDKSGIAPGGSGLKGRLAKVRFH